MRVLVVVVERGSLVMDQVEIDGDPVVLERQMGCEVYLVPEES